MAIPSIQVQRCLYTSWHLPTVIKHFIGQLHAVQHNTLQRMGTVQHS